MRPDIPNLNLRKVRQGDPVRAEDYNRLIDTVMDLAKWLSYFGEDRQYPVDYFVELDEDVESAETDKSATILRHTGSGTDRWEAGEQQKKFITDSQKALWLQGERRIVRWSPAASKFLILPGFNWHIGRLDAELSQGSSALASVWEWDEGGAAFADSGKNVTVYDWLMASGETVPALARIIFMHHPQSRKYIVMAAACAADAS